MAAVLNPPETSVVLHDISWPLYEQLLAEQDGKSNPRFTYDRGELEIMVLPYEHEKLNRLINDLITMVALEWDVEYQNAGSTTFKRRDLKKGFEPDTCFYVQNAGQIAGKTQLDLRTDPPPDLVVEVEITQCDERSERACTLDRLSIFAAVGVPEVWRYDGERMHVLRLAGESYVEEERSIAFPLLTGERLTAFLEESRQMPRTAWLRSVRDWARAERESA